MKTFVATVLASIAKNKLRHFKPRVIGVTGSVGKTSTIQAIAIALGAKHTVRQPYKNYNNDIGLPLTILGEHSPGRDAWEWLKLLSRASQVDKLPEYVVLEYGIDKPNDMDQLLNIAAPNVAVITAISAVHVSNYPDLNALINEKAKLGEAVQNDFKSLVLLNGDDFQVVNMRARFVAPVQTYSITNGDAFASDIRLEYPKEESFDLGENFVITRANLHVDGQSEELVLNNCCSQALVSAALAGAVVAVHEGVPLSEAVKALNNNLKPVNGRLRPLAGIKGSLILDDSYNAAPASVLAGLEALSHFIPGEEWDRRIAVLGDMAELGTHSDDEHKRVGEAVARAADIFVAVGPNMKLAMESSERHGLASDQIEWFKDSVEAGRYLDGILHKGDVVFVKGSQSMRMEKTVKDIMAEPNKAAELLVRQEPKWLSA